MQEAQRNRRAMRGVNLGGWLVLEKWMTPSLFSGTDAIDEYTFMQTPGAKEKIEKHRNTFITEKDFAWISKNGVEAIRIPVGYWIFGSKSPFEGCIKYLDFAFSMAEKYHLKVLIDLHAAPGSQNGQDHSGRVGKAKWYKRREYQNETVTVLCRLAKRYKNNPQFWGVELMNEPRLGIIQWKLRRFYNDAYNNLSAILPPNVLIIFHDAFTPKMMSTALRHRSHATGIDIHWYHFTFWAHRVTSLRNYWRLIEWHGKIVQKLQRHHKVIIGEWSGVLSGKVLQKYPKNEHDDLEWKNLKMQLNAYNSADAWFYWNYKTESGKGVWDFRSLVESGRLPLD